MVAGLQLAVMPAEDSVSPAQMEAFSCWRVAYALLGASGRGIRFSAYLAPGRRAASAAEHSSRGSLHGGQDHMPIGPFQIPEARANGWRAPQRARGHGRGGSPNEQ